MTYKFFNKNEKIMEAYDNLIDAIESLKNQGYVEDFNLRQNSIEARNRKFKIFHEDFHIDKQFRFDNNTDPADQSIIYAISSNKYDLKG
ncbi:MAG: hypothetical protein KA974_10485, partial [Saprospiraceae bacterium]|nr:hypothetical protein [Saprospiraceae bacterium]